MFIGIRVVVMAQFAKGADRCPHRGEVTLTNALCLMSKWGLV